MARLSLRRDREQHIERVHEDASAEIEVIAPHANGITPKSAKTSATFGILEIIKFPGVCVAP